MNTVSLIGRLTKDPEVKVTQGGKTVANFTLAVTRNFKNGNGDYEADFIQIQIWGKTAENAGNFLKKGSKAGVAGRIQTRNYEGQDGKRVYVTEVVADSIDFLDSKPKQNHQGQQPKQQPQGGYPPPQSGYGQPPQPHQYGGYSQQGAYPPQKGGYSQPPQQQGGYFHPGDDDLPF
ncbi:single-stranded DNA-binding protein [Bacillus badius]|uniref:single-stranded DNA-binding protein n=1 Tax=Bacillus badius TaxID=1455 RepID=UPI000696364E|nr:single-stranded DNA-binding protein [Bacillus badius]